MATITLTFDAGNTLQRIAQILGNQTGAFNGILAELGLQLRTWTEINFRDQGARFGGWAKMSVITMLFRTKGDVTARVRDWQSAVATANTIPLLQDLGHLRSSFRDQADPNAITNMGKMSISVGSSLPYAIKMNDGGTVPKTFTQMQQTRFWQRVDPGSPGQWNEWVFQMFNALRRDAGLTNTPPKSTTADIPARQILITSFSEEELEDLTAITQEGLDHLIHEMGLDRPPGAPAGGPAHP